MIDAGQQQEPPQRAPFPAEGEARGVSGEVSPPKKSAVEKPKLASFMSEWFVQYYRAVTLAACLVIFAALYALALHPKLARSRSISGGELRAVQGERYTLERQLGYLAKLSAESGRASAATIKDVRDLLPSDPATPQILTSLENIAHESGVVIDAVELVVPIEADESAAASDVVLPLGVSFVEVTLSVAASPYGALKTLLKNIEANIRLMDVMAVVYSPIGKSYSITLRAYYFLED
ncbi:MAG: hypothetical protein HYW81_01435 [Parcubacteria group bacterium]|nr:hypothetical protein [Parcubacteria group bacterium]